MIYPAEEKPIVFVRPCVQRPGIESIPVKTVEESVEFGVGEVVEGALFGLGDDEEAVVGRRDVKF